MLTRKVWRILVTPKGQITATNNNNNKNNNNNNTHNINNNNNNNNNSCTQPHTGMLKGPIPIGKLNECGVCKATTHIHMCKLCICYLCHTCTTWPLRGGLGAGCRVCNHKLAKPPKNPQKR